MGKKKRRGKERWRIGTTAAECIHRWRGSDLRVAWDGGASKPKGRMESDTRALSASLPTGPSNGPWTKPELLTQLASA